MSEDLDAGVPDRPAGAAPLPNFYPLIMAGGRGTRFWPRSRKTRSKQVLRVLGEESLIRQTFLRLRPLAPPERFLVVTNQNLREEIARQLPEVPDAQVIAEPAQRSTAACIGLAARLLLERDPEAVMGAFPADHLVSRPELFLRAVRRAWKAALSGGLVVLGIRPRGPETGYGYIEFARKGKSVRSQVPVRRFHEKPDLATARRYLRSGNFFWNSGMFLWKASAIDQALRRHLPATSAALDQLRGTPGEERFARALRAAYPRCDNISIDHAVLEKAPNLIGFPCGDLGWNDVGSWNAVYHMLPGDRQRNVARSETLFHQSTGNYVDAPGKLVALVGVNDLIVVDTADALLVARRDCAQQVGEVVRKLEKQKREDLL